MSKLITRLAVAVVVVLGASPLAGAGLVENVRVPIAPEIVNPCTGETILTAGELHIVTTSTTGRDGVPRVRIRYRFHLEGVGLETGNSYIINRNRFEDVEVGPGAEFSSVITERTRIISRGSASNALWNLRVVFRVDEGGDIELDEVDVVDCVG